MSFKSFETAPTPPLPQVVKELKSKGKHTGNAKGSFTVFGGIVVFARGGRVAFMHKEKVRHGVPWALGCLDRELSSTMLFCTTQARTSRHVHVHQYICMYVRM